MDDASEADSLVGMEIDLSNRDAWDDSALLSAFHASLSTHHTEGKAVPGDVRQQAPPAEPWKAREAPLRERQRGGGSGEHPEVEDPAGGGLR